MILNKALHHEEHRAHEEFSWSRTIFDVHPQGEFHFWNNSLLFFAVFVFFVVQMRNSE